MQGTPSPEGSDRCKQLVSGTISLPCSGYFQLFFTYLFAIGLTTYLALPDGSGRFTQNFTCSALLRIGPSHIHASTLPLWFHFPVDSEDLCLNYVRPTTPTMPKQGWFGRPARSPLLRESLIVFFPPGT